MDYKRFLLNFRCAHLHSSFPNTSIAFYDRKKHLCKIDYSPFFLKGPKYYIVTKGYQESSDEIALALNLDHYSIFPTDDGYWEDVKATCDKHNALLFQPEDVPSLYNVHRHFSFIGLHAGMYLDNGEWITSKGTKVTNFFWDSNEPSETENDDCGGFSPNSKMEDVHCKAIRKGLCIY